MIIGMQSLNPSLGASGPALLAPGAPYPSADIVFQSVAQQMRVANVGNLPNARAETSSHPLRVHRPSDSGEPMRTGDNRSQARFDFQTGFASASSEASGSGESAEGFFGAMHPSPVEVGGVDGNDVIDVTLGALSFDAPRAALPVLSAAALATLHVCASTQNINTRVAALEGRNHPVVMPEGRGERAQICRDIVGGSLLGTDGRNGTVPFDPSRGDVMKTVADTARRWTGKPMLAGKKEWTTACLMNTLPTEFINGLNDRLQAGKRLLPPPDSTAWMLRVGFSDGLPMHQAFVRGDFPEKVGLGADEWVKLALGIEQLGERHWDMRHAEVIDAAAMPATNTKAFMALATSLTSLAPHIATQRLRNQLTARGVPTIPAEVTSESPAAA